MHLTTHAHAHPLPAVPPSHSYCLPAIKGDITVSRKAGLLTLCSHWLPAIVALKFPCLLATMGCIFFFFNHPQWQLSSPVRLLGNQHPLVSPLCGCTATVVPVCVRKPASCGHCIPNTASVKSGAGFKNPELQNGTQVWKKGSEQKLNYHSVCWLMPHINLWNTHVLIYMTSQPFPLFYNSIDIALSHRRNKDYIWTQATLRRKLEKCEKNCFIFKFL